MAKKTTPTTPCEPLRYYHRFRIVTITQGRNTTYVAQRKVLGLFWWDISSPKLSRFEALTSVERQRSNTKDTKSFEYI